MSPVHCLQFFIFNLCVQLFTILTYILYYSELFTSIFGNNLLKEYDYIIVGSGTAGSIIAHRLATETNYTFIVLEAGASSNPLFEIPVLGPLLHGSVYDWQYETVPQKNACLAMKNNVCKLPQGKIMGGSSKLNNMIHIVGNLSHYVNWFHGKHNEEYIKQQFEFVENNILRLSELQYQSELANAILDAANELGYEKLDKEFKKGFMKSRLTQKNGKRWTSDELHISKFIATNVFVEKILINGGSAYGVEVLYRRIPKTKIYAKKGVILSAGTYNTPKILQLSGIGPADLLKNLEIPIVKDLPVGKNLQDHIASGLDLVMFNKSIKISAADILNPIHVFQYFLYGEGPLTSPGCEVVGFLSTQDVATPDLQFMVLPVGISSDRGSHLRKCLNFKDEIWFNYFAKTFDKHTATILPVLLHPKSKGVVYVKNKDPTIPPVIDPNYLSDKEDMEILTKGLQLVSKFVSTEAMKVIGAHINPIAFPGCENYKMFSEKYWECYVRSLTLTSYHPVGTCSMGLPVSKNAVVDTSFQVIGVKRLYIADGSVLPTLPSGNINAAIAMMASVFFDTNINLNTGLQIKQTLFCYRCKLLYEYLFNICL